MEKYIKRKKALVQRHLLHEISKIDSSFIDYSNLLKQFDGDEIKKKEVEKLEYAQYSLTLLNSSQSSHQCILEDNLLQTIKYQKARIDYLEMMFNKYLLNTSEAISDKTKINHALDVFMNEQRANNVNISSKLFDKKYKIAMFAPLSPLKNGIAHYTEDILVQLVQYFDIDVYIDTNYEPTNHIIIDSCKIYSHYSFEKSYRNYDAVIYQIGNNPDHVYMIPYLLKFPGIIVLHDFILSYLRSFLSEELKQFCDTNCNSIYYNGDNDGKNPFNKYIFQNARGIIVHSEYSKLGIWEQDFSKLITKIPLYSKCDDVLDDDTLKTQKYHYTQDTIILASFGFVTASKRIVPILQAFNKLKLALPLIKLKYLIVGQIEPEIKSEIDLVVARHKLFSDVVMPGYVSLDELENYINISDICINLRSPYGGETSAALSRIMGKGKACIVSDIGSFSELPDNVCIKIPTAPENEINNIYTAMLELVRNQKLRHGIAKAAHEYVKTYLNIEKSAEMYRNFIVEIIAGGKNLNYTMLKKIATFIACNSFYDENYILDTVTRRITYELLD